MPVMAQPAVPDWHPDPSGRFDSRYWDGANWTRAVMRDGQVDTDPSEGLLFEAPNAGAAADGAEPKSYAFSSPSAVRFTSLAPEVARARLGQLLALSGIQAVESAHEQLEATVSVKGEPNWVVVVALCLVWILPGVIYWYAKSRTSTYSVEAQVLPVEHGSEIRFRCDRRALKQLDPVLAQLPA
jgi:Protein of unknown function (DUF2510)